MRACIREASILIDEFFVRESSITWQLRDGGNLTELESPGSREIYFRFREMPVFTVGS